MGLNQKIIIFLKKLLKKLIIKKNLGFNILLNMDTSSLNNIFALLGYTVLGSGVGIVTYQMNPTKIPSNNLVMGLAGSFFGLGLGLVLENSRPLKVVEEKNETKITKLSIGGATVELVKYSLTPVAIIILTFVISSAVSKK